MLAFNFPNHKLTESSAYWLSIATQRWLSIRLDLLGSFLLLAVGLLAVGARYSISPAQTGVIVSYTFTVQQVGTRHSVLALAELASGVWMDDQVDDTHGYHTLLTNLLFQTQRRDREQYERRGTFALLCRAH